MATQSAVLTFALPEDTDSDQLLIYWSATKDGTYALATTVAYEYGTTTYEYDALEDIKWYKVQFNNSTDSETGAISDPVYGGDFSKSSPFLALSTTYDGANYATNQDVYDYSNLTTTDVTIARVSQALRRARAIVDLRTSDLDLDRFTRTFSTDVARKKYNATLRIVREAEINIALGNVYKGLADDLLMQNFREAKAGTDTSFQSVSIGQSAIAEGGGLSNLVHVGQLKNLSDRYFNVGAALLSAIAAPSVRLHVEEDFVRSPRFKLPFNGY